MLELARILAILAGLAVVASALLSALRTFVLPRSSRDPVTATLFRFMAFMFKQGTRRSRTYAARDRIMSLYAPSSLLLLPVVWLTLVLVGYTAIFWGFGTEPWAAALRMSGSSLLTLGFATVDDIWETVVSFSEAAIGLTLVALLIAYLPTMYAAFSRREAAVTLLEVRAGSPPSAAELIARYQRIHGLDHLGDLWARWEEWFVDVEETHTSLAAIALFRSPLPEHSWVTAAGAVLDAASLTNAVVDTPHDPRADLCIRAGYLALRHISDFFLIRYNLNPNRNDPISVTREDFDAACERVARDGTLLKADREQAWLDFKGWRVNYDTVLLGLCLLTMAPEAPWSSDRASQYADVPFLRWYG
jgi:hypothetical protein